MLIPASLSLQSIFLLSSAKFNLWCNMNKGATLHVDDLLRHDVIAGAN